MPVYYASDVHLRPDHPERADRFARWVDARDAADVLVIGGDLCDFWFAARQRTMDPLTCPGLRALAAFRARGGDLTIIPGNHDEALGPFYERTLGARFVSEPYEQVVHGLRVHLVHGHRLGARRFWKQCLESRTFLEAFRRVPEPLARGLDGLLEATNRRGLEASNARHLAVFREYAARVGPAADLVVIGHLHRPIDMDDVTPRLVVPGGWQARSSYLKIDEAGAALVVESESCPLLSRS